MALRKVPFFYLTDNMSFLLNIFILGIIAVIAFFIGKTVKLLLDIIVPNQYKSTVIYTFISSGIHIFFLIVIVWIAAASLGFESDSILTIVTAGSTLASFFITGIIENVTSGLNILTDRLFEVGDYVIIGTYEGKVEKITFSKTYLLTVNNERVTLENKQVANAVIINRSKTKTLRNYIKIPVKTGQFNRIIVRDLLKEAMYDEDSKYPDMNLESDVDLADAQGDIETWRIEFNVSPHIDIEDFKSELRFNLLNAIDAHKV
ncbi:MAG: mechanosensitive ion channel [Romboutsia sp.]|nr:mechanosensitive ion channel [Romboutsia sp.]